LFYREKKNCDVQLTVEGDKDPDESPRPPSTEDVTSSTGNLKSEIHAHKAVLKSVSTTFDEILTSHPTVSEVGLNGVSHSTLEFLIE